MSIQRAIAAGLAAICVSLLPLHAAPEEAAATNATTNAAVEAATSTSAVPAAAAAQVLPLQMELETACALARAHNPGLQRMRMRLVEQDGVIRETVAGRRPTLKADGSYTETDSNRQQSFGSDFSVDPEHWGASIEAAMPIFAGGRSTFAVGREKARRQALEAERFTSAADLVLAVQETYFDALLAQERVGVQREAIAVFDAQLALSSNRMAAGVGTQFDVLQAQVARANADPPLIRAENDYLRYADRLARLIGLPFPEGRGAGDIALAAPPLPELPDVDIQSAIDTGLEQRPELQQLHSLRSAETMQLRLSKRQKWPFVDAFAEYGIENDQFGGGDELRGWVTGVRLGWTLGDGGVAAARIRQSRARMEQLSLQQDERVLAVEGEVREAVYDYQEARSILATAGLVIEQAREAQRMATNRYGAGSATQLEVQEAQLQLTQAQLDYFTAARDIHVALARFERALGRTAQ